MLFLFLSSSLGFSLPVALIFPVYRLLVSLVHNNVTCGLSKLYRCQERSIVCNHLAALRVRQRLKDPRGTVGLRCPRLSSPERGRECLRGTQRAESLITGKGSVVVLLRARLRPRGAAFPGLARAVPLMVACLASQTPVALYKSRKRSSGCDVCHQSVLGVHPVRL